MVLDDKIHIHTQIILLQVKKMGTKTISISDEAYSKLRAEKRGKESFTDAILRLTGRKSLSEIIGFLSEKEAGEMRRVIREMREKSRTRTLKAVEETK